MLPVIDPILPVLSRELPRGGEWRYEVKLDGFRSTFYIDDGEVLETALLTRIALQRKW